MSEQRFRLDYEEDDAIFIVEDDDIVYPIRNDTIKEYQLQKLVDKFNEQQATITELERKLKKYAKIGEEQLKQIMELQDLCGLSDVKNAKLRIENELLRKQIQKYEEGTEKFTFPPNCDECDFLGNNGICGYCKFTLNCYDSKEDLIDGRVLPNCPLKPLINVLNEQQATINKQEEIIKSQDMEISRQYNLCLAMNGVLREEFGVYDVFDRTKDRKIE